MIDVSRTFHVDRAEPVVRNYLRDFSHAVQWDPGTKSCVQSSSGPVAVGTTWANVSEFRGKETKLTYRLDAEDDGGLHFVGENKTATSHDDISLTADGARTRITYRARIEFHGLAKLATPLLRKEFERLGDETQRDLIAAVAKL